MSQHVVFRMLLEACDKDKNGERMFYKNIYFKFITFYSILWVI